MTLNKPDLKCKNAKQRDDRGPHVSEAEILIMKFTSQKKTLFFGKKEEEAEFMLENASGAVSKRSIPRFGIKISRGQPLFIFFFIFLQLNSNSAAGELARRVDYKSLNKPDLKC